MLSWLNVPADQILNAERDLRLKGTFRDDLGDFYEIVRRASPGAWETMSGDASAAVDFRMAADIFTSFESGPGLTERSRGGPPGVRAGGAHGTFSRLSQHGAVLLAELGVGRMQGQNLREDLTPCFSACLAQSRPDPG